MLDLRAVIARKLAAAGWTEVQHLDRCTSCHPDLFFSHRRDRGVTGRQAGLVVLRWSLTRVRRNLERVRERIGPEVEICAAVKYVAADDLPALAEAGIELVGENRAQDLLAKQEAHRDLFTWDFIGALQSRKVKDIAPNVRLIHSVASESALRQLEQYPAARC